MVRRKDGQGFRYRHTAEYLSFRSMKDRCLRPRSIGYERYGGRGVKICDRWLLKGGFEKFLADMGPRPLGKTLDRKDPFKDYCPENCQWADIDEQHLNRRFNFVQIEGEHVRKDKLTEEDREMLGLDPEF
jgi:hypothetical protein